ncbi:GNAT family N-acetyltransferase [Erythrobacter sp. KY5]|uniref:GNAT family N-acetyltransferase n=1 Tax=Erythrobacter sp. KY5 TaxID=2011159 RepID=UPI000DBF07CF|nr:GNAT family N-acetyltransferase [Erythrobacter sp. KY5]AWW73103.1 GNAT family N-acetyltransferase [Erythrobacter sp. KY5]
MTDIAEKVSITHHAQGQGGKYVAVVEGEKAQGHLEWEPQAGLPQEQVAAGVRVATHTIVPQAIGGRGIAGLLVERLVSDARAKGFKIVPQCSYVAKKFEENPDWADLKA